MMPPLPNGSTTVLITPHLVPPSASAPSFSPGGACENTSRITAVQIGMIISATTMPGDERRRRVAREVVRLLGLEERDEAEVGAQPPAQVDRARLEEGAAPEAVDQARDRGEHVDERRERAAQPGRRVLGHEQRGADRRPAPRCTQRDAPR